MPRRKLRRAPGGPRMTVLNPEIRGRFLDAIRGGTPLSHAATYAGMGQRTLWQTLERGELAEERLEAGEVLGFNDEVALEFWREVQKARSGVAVRNVTLVQRAAQGGQLLRERTMPDGRVEREFAPIDWRAAKYMLGISFKGEFAENSAVQVSGPGGGPIEVSASTQALAESLRAQLERGAEDEVDVVEGEVVDG